MDWLEALAEVAQAAVRYQKAQTALAAGSSVDQDWIWMPHAAHLCVSNRCQFRLATYVNGVIVSTVGEYIPGEGQRYQTIGYDRLYETMVFKARSCEPEECEACPYRIDDAIEIDMAGYNTAREAYAGHMAMCEKWSK